MQEAKHERVRAQFKRRIDEKLKPWKQDYSRLTGARLLVRRAVFEEVGGFDETLPIAFNDVDFCIKMRRAGARIVWIPSVAMYHHESVTLGQHDSARRRGQFRHDVGVMRDQW